MTRASERVRSPCENQQSEESLSSSLTEAGRLAMTSALWAPLDIEFQTFDRLIDRKPSRRPHHPPHQFTHNSHYHPPAKSLPKRLQERKTLLHVARSISCRRLSRYCREDSSSTAQDRHVLSFAQRNRHYFFHGHALCLPSTSLVCMYVHLHRLACSAADLVGAHALLCDRQQKSTW